MSIFWDKLQVRLFDQSLLLVDRAQASTDIKDTVVDGPVNYSGRGVMRLSDSAPGFPIQGFDMRLYQTWTACNFVSNL